MTDVLVAYLAGCALGLAFSAALVALLVRWLLP